MNFTVKFVGGVEGGVEWGRGVNLSSEEIITNLEIHPSHIS